jgi:hypothetical protein
MPYERRTPRHRLDKTQKVEIVAALVEHYRDIYPDEPDALNRKLPKSAFADLLDEVGELLVERSRSMATEPGPVRDFLVANPLPTQIEGLLPMDYRAFCLALNALKQWVSAEQLATDRFLLGGTARKTCREAAKACIVTGESLEGGRMELHHPLRDGRPPVPLSEEGHARIEGQVRANSDEDQGVGGKLRAQKKEKRKSWAHLARGCLDHLQRPVNHSTPAMAANARSFAKTVRAETGLEYEEILAWLSKNTNAVD